MSKQIFQKMSTFWFYLESPKHAMCSKSTNMPSTGFVIGEIAVGNIDNLV